MAFKKSPKNKTYHIRNDFAVMECRATEAKNCPFNKTELTERLGIESHYTGAFPIKDLDILAASMRAAKEADELYKQKVENETYDFGFTMLDMKDKYGNFKKIEETFNTAIIQDGPHGRKRLLTGEFQFTNNDDDRYTYVLQRRIGIPESYIDQYTPYYGGDYMNELKSSAVRAESIIRTDDGKSIVKLKDPYRYSPVYVLRRIDNEEKTATIAHCFSAEDIDGSFDHFMSRQTLVKGGPQMWNAPLPTTPLMNPEQIEAVKHAAKMTENMVNPKRANYANSFQMADEAEPITYLHGFMTDGLTPALIDTEVELARRNVGSHGLSVDLIDNKEQGSPDGWNNAWGLKRTPDGQWFVREATPENGQMEYPVNSQEEMAERIANFIETKYNDPAHADWSTDYAVKIWDSIEKGANDTRIYTDGSSYKQDMDDDDYELYNLGEFDNNVGEVRGLLGTLYR